MPESNCASSTRHFQTDDVLATLYQKEGRADEIRPLAEEIASFVNRPEKAREAQEALALLRAAESGIA